MTTRHEETTGALEGICVLDLSRTLPGALATQFLCDAGADVLLVEPPAGSPLRQRSDWPALGRGKRSVMIDLHTEAGRAELDARLADADVLVTTFRPAVLRALGLTPDRLAARHPHLVSAAITGWGSTGPWADLKGYEGLVMAKLGILAAKQLVTSRKGPAFVTVPYASWGAAQTALQGIMSALLERETSGRGQHVEADLIRGMSTIDTWRWFTELIALRWPGAYEVADAYNEKGEVQAHLTYALLIAPTKDGSWLQFAQVQPRLFQALFAELGLTELFTDPKWAGLPILPTQELRTELWDIMLTRVSERTLAEWQHVFDTNPNICAEVFRDGASALEHPQLLHDGRVVTVTDPDLGPVRQPSTLVHSGGAPLRDLQPAPRLGAGGEARSRASSPPADASAREGLPLAGLTVLEFAVLYAAPYGATMLTDLGARVIKVEALTGDAIRTILPFPESGAAKAMQGKESIALDLATEEGLRIVHELARRSDVVMQGFRAGAVERAHIDPATLKAINPDLVYVNAPGYGTDGPFGDRPAYAPSIGAAAGLALTDAPDAARGTGSLADVKRSAARLSAAVAVLDAQADGIAALGVASTMLLGLLARARSRPLGTLTATMIGSATHAIQDYVIDYPDRPPAPEVNADGSGLSALYRMYPTPSGWVFLAAPAEGEWAPLCAALAKWVDLDGDTRFASASGRREHDVELSAALLDVFAGRPAVDWELELTAAGVGCVQVYEGAPQYQLQTDPDLRATYTASVVSPIFDEHLRMDPVVRFSRSATQVKGFCLAGEHTDALLHELGYDDDAIADLRVRKIVN